MAKAISDGGVERGESFAVGVSAEAEIGGKSGFHAGDDAGGAEIALRSSQTSANRWLRAPVAALAGMPGMELSGRMSAVILKDAAVLIASGVASRKSLPALNLTHPV